jgi:FdhD protein
VVREEPLLIELAGQQVLTMRTPGHDEELALGFLLAEGILDARADVIGAALIPRGGEAAVDLLRVALREGRSLAPLARERLSRAHAIRPSCGLCGLTSAEGLTRDLPALRPGAPRVTLAALLRMAEGMLAEQPLFHATGGAHAAALFPAGDPERPWAVREDVGRHNALDKALGRALLDGRDLSGAVAILSGRGGYELVLKALRLGVPVVASVGAPSSLAVELAEERGLTLVGFLRDAEGARVYADEGRL